MTWTDDFTHDYFADSTYTLIGGAEGAPGVGTFQVGGGHLTAFFVEWADERSVITSGQSELDIDFATFGSLGVAYLNTTGAVGALGVLYGGAQSVNPPGTALVTYVTGSGSGFAETTFAGLSGPIAVVFDLESDKVKLSVGADSVETPVSPTDFAALGTLDLVPWVVVNGFVLPDDDMTEADITKWTHPGGGGPPPVTLTPGVRAGLQSSGLVPLHPLA